MTDDDHDFFFFFFKDRKWGYEGMGRQNKQAQLQLTTDYLVEITPPWQKKEEKKEKSGGAVTDEASVWVCVLSNMVKTHMVTGRSTPPPHQHLPWLTIHSGKRRRLVVYPEEKKKKEKKPPFENRPDVKLHHSRSMLMWELRTGHSFDFP